MTMVNLEIINVGQAPNDGTGDTHRDSFQKTNRNMSALKAALEDAFKTVEIPASANLNAYTTTGTFHQSANAGAVGGTNYPEGTAGLLQVVAAGTSFVYQRYVTTGRRSYWRTRAGGDWAEWVRMLDASMLGAANGAASLGADRTIPREQLPVLTAVPVVAGTDANTVTDPGSYYINSDADATLALNWPELRAGTLVVERAGAGNVQVTQTYTTRGGSGGVSRTYKRVRFTTSNIWYPWQELARLDEAMKSVALSVGTDANTLTAPNTFYTWGPGAVVSGGVNWPAVVPGSGALTVAVMATTTVIQSLELLTGVGRRPVCLQRARINGAWDPWFVVAPLSSTVDLPTANHGDVYVDGDGWYAWNGSAYARRSLAKTLVSIDLNSVDVPGAYACNVSAEATPALNYPVQLAGILEVVSSQASNLQVTQTYTAFPETSPVTYKRVRFGASKVWGPWLEQARLKDAMHRVALSAAAGINANTLTADNTFYTWESGSTITGAGGANWPPVNNGTVGAGFLEVFCISSGAIVQRCTLLGNAQKPRVFQRFGAGSSWESWRITASLSSSAFLPVADCGEVYVDGVGVYQWNGTNYTPQTPVTGVLLMKPSAVIMGEFPGQASATGNRFMSYSGDTYLAAVPGAGGSVAGLLARNADSANSQFVGMSASLGGCYLLFSRHGTAAVPPNLIISSGSGECGRVVEDGRWQFGRFVQPNVQTKLHVSFNGGGLEYGIVTRPVNASDSTAIQFQSSSGGVAGYIYSTQALTTTYATTSDYRAKTDLGNLDPENSLATINALRPILFRMNEAPEGSEIQRGFIAHELQEKVPNAVVGKKDEMMAGPGGPDAPEVPRYQGVDMSRIMPDMVAAVQRLTQMLEETNRSLVTANNRIAQLEAAGSPATPE
ncbi:pyocin knob domain-containing S74 family peptidase [Achromobacter aegrifaciens]|uniref:pyocin knob domain-containing S74 family peptidase n=1 Tax=Achromobacter aegrifaciens TaxID=1287736 RepID=UPI0028AF0FDC|nr:pyocin knob domain-containing S74 family peptidase [Achromobacter aegrifaciens]